MALECRTDDRLMLSANNSSRMTRILLVEDSNTDAMLIQAHLKRADASFDVRREVQLSAGLLHLDQNDVDVVLLDLNLPDSSGLDTFRAIHRHSLQMPIVVLSGQDDIELALDAVALGAQDYLPKGEANRSSLMRSIRYAIERSRRQRAEQELSAAGEIQRRLFPQNSPVLAGFDIFGRCEPANLAGGDYFDYFPMRNNCWGIVVADVAGHGIGPALIMSETRAILRSLAKTHADVGEILTHANQVLSEDLHNNVFVAMILISLNPSTRQISFASAGHPAILLDSRGQIQDRLCSVDPPLGLSDDRRFQTNATLSLKRGNSLLLYTDGIVETFNEEEEQFGERRMLDALIDTYGGTSQESVDELFRRVGNYASQHGYHDDRTSVVLKVT